MRQSRVNVIALSVSVTWCASQAGRAAPLHRQHPQQLKHAATPSPHYPGGLHTAAASRGPVPRPGITTCTSTLPSDVPSATTTTLPTPPQTQCRQLARRPAAVSPRPRDSHMQPGTSELRTHQCVRPRRVLIDSGVDC